MAAWDFITLAEVKAYLKISNNAQDAFLSALISDTCKYIEDYTRGIIAQRAFNGIITNGNGLSWIISPRKPVAGIVGESEAEKLASVQYRTDPTSSWRNIVDDSRYILIDEQRPYRLELYGAIFPPGIGNIKLNIIAGYNPVPGDLRRVALEAVAEQWLDSRQGLSRLGLASEGVSQAGGSATTAFRRLAEEHRYTLNRYVWRVA